MSDATVIRLISENFVPVAANLYVIREDKGPEGDFFRKLSRQLPEQYQGLYLATPEGKLLTKKTLWAKEAGKTWPESVAGGLREALEAFGPVRPRQGRCDYLARRGVGLGKDGGAIVAVSTKLLFVPRLPEDLADLNPSAIPATGHDRVLLSAAALSSLVPAKVAAGVAWTVPEATARQFFPVLDNWDKRFRKPDEVTSVRLAGKVRSVLHGVAYLTFEGDIAGTHVWGKESGPALAGKSLRSELKLVAGVGACDAVSGKLLSLTLVFQGRSGDLAALRSPGQGNAFAAVARWRQKPQVD